METATPPTPTRAPRNDPRSGLFAALLVFAIAALVAALIAAAFLWRELESARTAARERERTVFQLAETDRATFKSEIAEAQRLLRDLATREDTLEREQAALRSRTEAGRGTFALAEARHLLELANESLHLARDPERAADALRAADARLAELGDARTVAARAEIARELAALAALPRVDAPGLALALLGIEERVAHLPLRTRLPQTDDATPHEELAPPSAWAHLVERVQHAFRGLITVRRATEGTEPLLAPDQEFFLRRNLELKLETARLAALARDGAAFRLSTRTARDWLAVHFDPNAPAVREAVRDLDAMQRLELSPPLPDLTRAFTLLEQRGAH